MMIEKAKETMSSRERVRKTFEFEKTDRVPIGYDANAGIHARLCAALGIAPHNTKELYEALGVDTRPIGAPYIGPQLHPVPENRMVNQLEGCIMRWVEHASGGYHFAPTHSIQDNSPVENVLAMYQAAHKYGQY